MQPVQQPFIKKEEPAPVPVIVQQPIIAQLPVKEEEAPKPVMKFIPEPEENIEFTLVMKETTPPPAPAKPVPAFTHQPIMDVSDEEEQRRRATERINKLRNISFNMNTNHDVTGEFENVPAYVRRNMELFGSTLASVENYYSKYSVKKDDNNPQAQISTMNKFLDEKKPD